jgi:hypothetical protein
MAVMVVLGAATARAVEPICDVLGPALHFNAVGSKQIIALSLGARGYYAPSPLFFNSACAPVVKLGRRGRWGDDIVATNTSGKAVRFRVQKLPDKCNRYMGYYSPCIPYACGGQFPYGYPCLAHEFFGGNIVTGGGAVSPDPSTVAYGFPYYAPAAIDTTGTNSQVAACTQAIAQADVASAALARHLLPGEPPGTPHPVFDLGNVYIERDDSRVFDSVDGERVTFYDVGNLTLEAGKLYRGYYGQPGYQAEGASIQLASGPDEMVVINVRGTLRLGAGTRVSDFSGGNLIHVVGEGGSIFFRRQAYLESSLLAPQRLVKLLAYGGGTEWPWGVVGAVYARDVRVTGSGFFGYYGAVDPVADCGLPDD